MEYDFNIYASQSIGILTPQTKCAKEWADENIDSPITYGNGIAIEMRYLYELTAALLNEGFTIEKDDREMFLEDDGEFYLRAKPELQNS